jgi:hypothetical protein
MVGLDNLTGPTPSLVLEDIERLQAMRAQGMPNAEVARALGVSVRTVQRYRQVQLVHAEVAGHVLPFIVWRPGARPSLVARRHESYWHKGCTL